MFSEHPDIARRWASEEKNMQQFPGGTKADNMPVGSAGQPTGKDAKMNAIQRRLKAKRAKDTGAKN